MGGKGCGPPLAAPVAAQIFTPLARALGTITADVGVTSLPSYMGAACLVADWAAVPGHGAPTGSGCRGGAAVRRLAGQAPGGGWCSLRRVRAAHTAPRRFGGRGLPGGGAPHPLAGLLWHSRVGPRRCRHQGDPALGGAGRGGTWLAWSSTTDDFFLRLINDISLRLLPNVLQLGHP